MHGPVRDDEALILPFHRHPSGSTPDPDDHRGGMDVERLILFKRFFHVKKQAAVGQVQFELPSLFAKLGAALFIQGDDLGIIQADRHKAFYCR